MHLSGIGVGGGGTMGIPPEKFWWNRCQIVLFWANLDEKLRLKDTAFTWLFSAGSPYIHDNEIITDFKGGW